MINISHYKIVAIGKIKKKWIQEGLDMYLKRLPGLEVIELNNTKKKEEDIIKGIISKNEVLVTLNERGQSFSSKQLATKLLNSHNRKITFVIGGAEGLSPSFDSSASWQLSLSPLTFPHEIARLLLVEQLYRAKTIAQGSPYHKD